MVLSECDFESWNGLFGTLIQNDGKILDNNHEFEFINDNGTLKTKQ